MTEYKCDHCGKVEDFDVLCAECSDLACEECGQVICACDETKERESEGLTVDMGDAATSAVYNAVAMALTTLCVHKRCEVMALLLVDFESVNRGFIAAVTNEMDQSMDAAMKDLQEENSN